MAIAYVGIAQEAAGSNDGAASTVATVARTVATGNIIVAFVNWTGDDTPAPTLADQNGQNIPFIGSKLQSDNYVGVFFKANVTGSTNTVWTASLGENKSYRRLHVLEFSGASTTAIEPQAGPVNFLTFGSGSSAAPATADFVLGGNGAVVAACATYNTAGSFTAGTGQTEASSDDYLHSQYRIVTTAGTYANNGTISGADLLAFIGIALRETPSTGIAGTLTATLGALSCSAAAKLALKGASAATLANLTPSASGKLPIVGSTTQALATLASGSAARLAIAAAGSPTLANVLLAAVGVRPPIAGTASLTLADLGVGSAGKLSLVGSAIATLAPLESSASARLAVVAVASAQLGDVGLSAAARLVLAGAGTATLADLVALATGKLATAAAAALSLDPVTASGAGRLELRGTAPLTLAPLSGELQGALRIAAAAAISLDSLDPSAAGQLELAAGTGVVSQVLGDVAASSGARLGIGGATTQALQSLDLTAEAAAAIRGTLGVQLDAATLLASGGGVRSTGELAIQLAGLSCESGARLMLDGAVVQTLETLLLTSASRLASFGSAVVVLADCSITATGSAGLVPVFVIGTSRQAPRHQQAARQLQEITVARQPQINTTRRRN